LELDLKDTIIPDQSTGRFLADMVEGQDLLALSALIKDEARIFSFVVQAENEAVMRSLQLPDDSRIICLYRDNKFIIPDPDFSFKVDDEVVILTHSRNLAYLNNKLLNKPEIIALIDNGNPKASE